MSMKTHVHQGLMVVIMFMLVMLCPLQTIGAEETFTMAFFDSPENEPLMKYAELIYTDAFHRLGYQFAYTVYPTKRCSVMANDGEVGGEPGRIASYNEAYPNLVRIEEPILSIKKSAFALNSEIRLDGWESLKDTTYRVEYVRGIQHDEMNLPKYVPADRLSEITTVEQGLKKLIAGRTDIFIAAEDFVVQALKNPEFQDAKVYNVGLMQSMEVYPFVHKNYTDLAAKLADVLKQMKQEGLFEKYQEQTKLSFSK